MPPDRSNEGQIVYDPRGVVEAEPRALATRVSGLDGLRLAVLDNAKWNANKLLRRTAARLEQEANFASVDFYRKESFSKVAAPELIDEIVAKHDIALTAIGD